MDEGNHRCTEYMIYVESTRYFHCNRNNFGGLFMQNKNITKLLAVLPMAALITGCGRASINANDYLEVNIDGYDTAAQASYSIDYEKMIEDNAEAFGIDEKSGSEMLGLEMLMEEHLDGKLDKTSEIKNGDEVVFKWDDNAAASIEEKYKVKIKLSEEKITVKDLEEAQKFDPFEFVNVVFDGISLSGAITYINLIFINSINKTIGYFTITKIL